MLQHRFTTTHIATTGWALFAAILIACGTTTGPAGRAPAETPGLGSNVRVGDLEPEFSGKLGHQAVDPGFIAGEASSAVAPKATRLADTSLRPNEVVD